MNITIQQKCISRNVKSAKKQNNNQLNSKANNFVSFGSNNDQFDFDAIKQAKLNNRTTIDKALCYLGVDKTIPKEIKEELIRLV